MSNSILSEIFQLTVEVSELHVQIEEKKQKSMLIPCFLVFLLFLIFAFCPTSAHSQNAKPLYITESVEQNGKNVNVYRKTSTENVKEEGTAMFTAYVRVPTAFKCGRMVQMFKESPTFWKEVPVWTGCEDRPFVLEIQAGAYSILNIPLEKEEMAFITVETTGGVTLFSQTVGYVNRKSTHSIPVTEGSEVRVVISDGSSH